MPDILVNILRREGHDVSMQVDASARESLSEFTNVSRDPSGLLPCGARVESDSHPGTLEAMRERGSEEHLR